MLNKLIGANMKKTIELQIFNLVDKITPSIITLDKQVWILHIMPNNEVVDIAKHQILLSQITRF